ncbi:MAG TPA: alpha/beta fold hydrolase [Solirubrobacter sp.]|nr:alpha/beta fold hydrolase [Solirubrobacter sp.]
MPGSTVLLLHGSGPGTTGAAWASLAEALAPHHRVIAPDLPGFGDAPAAPIEAWAELLAPEEPCAIVGNSAGGALALALAHAGAATRVVAVGSMGAPMPIPPALDALWGATDARAVLELIFPGPVSDEAVAARRAAMDAQPHYLELFPAPRQRWVDALSLTFEQLASINVPVLLIHGSEDRIVPLEHGLTLLRALPDARMHIFGGCGHATPLERTDEFNELVRNFLQ